MPSFGACHPCFKADGKQSGVVCGKLVSANLTVNNATGEIYADDILAEQVSEFASGTIALETDDMEDDVASEVYGCTVEDSTVTYNIGDEPPKGCLGYYKTLKKNGKKKYKAFFYPNVRATLGNDNAQTKGSSITFQTTQTSFTVFADDNGDWRKTYTCDTASEAVEWVNERCGIKAASA